jgi:hypothetical protein
LKTHEGGYAKSPPKWYIRVDPLPHYIIEKATSKIKVQYIIFTGDIPHCHPPRRAGQGICAGLNLKIFVTGITKPLLVINKRLGLPAEFAFCTRKVVCIAPNVIGGM